MSIEKPLSLDEFVSRGWRDHAQDAEGVFARLPQGIELTAEAKHLPALSGLIVHVAGEHLGRWAEGVDLLEALKLRPVFDAATPEGKAVLRSAAVLHRCAGNTVEEARCFEASRSDGEFPASSDRIRVLSVAAAALVGQKRLPDARRNFEEALSLASYGPTAEDPAARSLAVTGNNLACEFENRPELTSEERTFMLRAAFAGRDFWRIAGGWKEEERAEYRLAMSHLKAEDPTSALAHARRCLAIVDGNGSEAGEAFFAREAGARALLAGGDVSGAREERVIMAALLPEVGDESFRAFCGKELAKLDTLLAGC